jgi:hypothetical protein
MHRLMRFNDSPRTTHDDVMALFDRTIRHLAAGRVAELVEIGVATSPAG